jgi:hypothetical protein
VKHFSYDTVKVQIVAPMSPEREWLRGRFGTVVRIRTGDDCAWIDIEGEALPGNLRSFPHSNLRANHIICAPEECEAAK